MKLKVSAVIAAARTPVGRAVTGAVGLGCVTLIVRGIGFNEIVRVLTGAATLFPLVFALDAAQIVCTILALRSLWGPAVPRAQLVRAGLIGYAVAGLVPAGRVVGEVARATLVTRYIGAGRATAAIARIQGAAIINNAVFLLAGAGAVWATGHGPIWVPLAMLAVFAVNMGIGVSVLVVPVRARLGARLGKRVPKAQQFGTELDDALANEPMLPWPAIGWELVGGVAQAFQNAALLGCVGGAITLANSLASEGIHLVGTAMGDLVPGQIGATEGNYTLAASALGLPVAGAVAIALIAHVSQLVWVAIGSVVSVVWPAPALPTDPALAPLEKKTAA